MLKSFRARIRKFGFLLQKHFSQESAPLKKKSQRLVHLLWLAGKRHDKVLFNKYLPLAQAYMFSQKEPPSQLTLKMFLFALRSFSETHASGEISWVAIERVILNKITKDSGDIDESDFLLIASTFSKAGAGSDVLWLRLAAFFESLIFKENKSLNIEEQITLLCAFTKASSRLPSLKENKFISELLAKCIKLKMELFSHDDLVEVLTASVKLREDQGRREIVLQALNCLKLKQTNLKAKHYAVAIWSAAKVGIRNNPIKLPGDLKALLQQMNSTEYIMTLWGLVKIDKLTPEIRSILINLFLRKNYNFKFDGLAIIGWCFSKLELKEEGVWEKYYKLSQNAMRLKVQYPLRDYANFAWTLKMNQKSNNKPRGTIYNLLEEKLIATLGNRKCDISDHGSLSGIALVLSRADRGSALLWTKLCAAFKKIYSNPEFSNKACSTYDQFGVFVGNLSCFSEVFPGDEELWNAVEAILQKSLVFHANALSHRDLSNIVRSLGSRKKLSQPLLETVENMVQSKLKQRNISPVKGLDLFNYVFFSKNLGWGQGTYRALKEYSMILERDLDRKKNTECNAIFKMKGL